MSDDSYRKQIVVFSTLAAVFNWLGIFLPPGFFCALMAYQFPEDFWWPAGWFLCYVAFVFAGYLSLRNQEGMPPAISVRSIAFSCGIILWWISAIGLDLWLHLKADP
jgi:hypothetical protein